MTGEPTILVSGASGHVGSLVVHELLDRGVAPDRLVATTRSPEKLAALAAKGVDVRRADLDDPESLRDAFAGVDRMLLIATIDMFPPGRRVIQNRAGIDAAVAAGVSHIVYTSGGNPEPPTPMFWDADHWETEQHLRASGSGWSILRMQEFMEGHLDQILAPAIEKGRMYSAAGDGRIGYVARRDYARAAAAILAADSSDNRTYTVTGPELLSISEVMELVSEASGNKVEITQTTLDERARHMQEEGQPEWLVPAWVALDQGISEGCYAIVTDAVKRLTGRRPMSFREFLQERVQENGSVLRRAEAPHIVAPV